MDPSSHGGLVAYTALIATAVQAAGGDVTILGSSALSRGTGPVRMLRWLPVQPWGRPADAGPAFYLRRAEAWMRSALLVAWAVRQRQPNIIHFQAPINRRFDAQFLHWLSQRRPVVWTAHDVLPFEGTDADRDRFAALYRAVDRVIVHTEPAAEEMRSISGINPTVIEHPVPEDVERVPAAQARASLGLPIEGRLFCALGFIRSYKGYGLLADVWERLGAQAPQLLVMGELLGEDERPVVERLEQIHRVDLRLGYASERDMQLAVCAADALLLPYVTASDSGLVHLGRALGVPVIASDTEVLAASVRATGAGVVIPRDVEVWASTVTATLPAPPPAPPPLAEVGARHMTVYQQALAARSSAPRLRLVLYTDADELGGAEQVMADLVAELDPEVDLIVMGVNGTVVDWVARERPGSRTCLVPAVRGKRDLHGMLAHSRALRALRPHLFQANLRHPWSCQYGLAAALLTPGTKVVALEHLPTPPTAALQRRLKHLTSRRLDAHIAVGHRSARELEGLIGLPTGTIQVIHNGVQGGEPTPRRPVPTGRSVIGALGRLTPQKGFDVLLHALVDLPEVHAVILGEGPERRRLEQIRDELGLGDRVQLPGSTEDPSEVLNSIDALVLSSRFEALPLVVLEAMHAGLPVVATDVGSVAEAVIDGVTGLLVPPDDPRALAGAIAQVLDPNIGQAMGRRAGELARTQFTRERMAREYQLVYGKLRS